MIQKTFLTIALLFFFTHLFAASCPTAADFEKKPRNYHGGYGYGYTWILPEKNNKEGWTVSYYNPWEGYIPSDDISSETKLLVRFNENKVSCEYKQFKVYVEKAPDLEHLSPKTSPYNRYGKESICYTTAGNPAECSWEWAKT